MTKCSSVSVDSSVLGIVSIFDFLTIIMNNISKSSSQSSLSDSNNKIKINVDTIKLDEYDKCSIDHQNQINSILFPNKSNDETPLNDNFKSEIKAYSTDEIFIVLDNYKKSNNINNNNLSKLKDNHSITNLLNQTNKFEDINVKDKTDKGRLLDVYPPINIDHTSIRKKRRNHIPTIKNTRFLIIMILLYTQIMNSSII